MALGTLARKVNSQAYKVYVTSTSNEYIMLQDANLDISHSELREATTSGGAVYYSGNNDNRLTGTLLYTTDLWSTATIGFAAMLTRTNGEVPTKTILVKLTDQQGSPTTETYTCSVKLETYRSYKSAEGGVKVDVAWVVISDPVVS